MSTEKKFLFRHLIARARAEEPALVAKILTASISSTLAGLGSNVINVPTEIIAQRAVGTLALTLLHLDDADDLFTDMNEGTDGVQAGSVGEAITKATGG